MPRLVSPFALAIPVLLLLNGPVAAHTGQVTGFGFGDGFTHPLGGFDHVLVMVGVGILAARLGGSGLWGVPLTFVALMVGGFALGLAGTSLPLVETAILLSIAGTAALVVMAPRLSTLAAMAAVGLFAVFHGHAHGAEMPAAALAPAYAAGFVLATALLHAAGLVAGLVVVRATARRAA